MIRIVLIRCAVGYATEKTADLQDFAQAARKNTEKHIQTDGVSMPRAAKKDQLATMQRCFLDPRSFISRDGREFLAGEDMSVRRHEVFERCGGFCEEPGCNRQIDEHLPKEHPNAFHCHHVKYRSKGGAENLNNLQAACTRCHKKHHADREPQFRGSRAAD